MNLEALQRQVELEMQRQAIFALAVAAILFIVGAWVTYLVVKAAIRDGIKESGLVESWDTTARKARTEGETTLPEMRAER